jgi:hypothetical protein
MRWLLVSTNDDVCLIKQDNYCRVCFERKTRKTVLMDEPLEDHGPERSAWIDLARSKSIKVYGTVACTCAWRSIVY